MTSHDTPDRRDCPGCGSHHTDDGPQISGQPVMMHSLCSDHLEAIALGKGTLRLKECHQCGLIFNAALDFSLLNYDSSYDNRQGFSPTFRDHLDQVAGLIQEGFFGTKGRVLEIGCGKGEFLRLLRDRGASRCVGYDTSATFDGKAENEGLEFYTKYATAEDIQDTFDVIVCRHVVEHVPEIRDFFLLLASISRAAGKATVVVETPAFEWIAEKHCFWDYFYEHCNYFTLDSLSKIAQSVGFKVVFHHKVFGDQYQLIALRLAPDAPTPKPAHRRYLLDSIEDAERTQKQLASKIKNLRKGNNWAIWGAGAKGVTLAVRLKDEHLLCAIDANPAKAGRWLPGSGIPIVSPTRAPLKNLGLIVIANPIYEREIIETLRQNRFEGRTITV